MAILVIFCCILCYLLERRKVVLQVLSEDISINLNEITNDGANEANFRVISYTCVKAATNNFSLENKLGEGGFGPVYKAWDLWQAGEGLELIDLAISDSCVKKVLRWIQLHSSVYRIILMIDLPCQLCCLC
ncbi:hypothetical protein ACB092_11G042800 [Castanea dentata]